LTLMPVRRVNASSVGWFRPLSSTSMYSVQLEKLTLFSFAEWSSAETPPSVFPAAGMPQALSAPAPPIASAPPAEARSRDRRVRAARPLRKLRRMAATWAGERRSGSYCSMRVVPFREVAAGRAAGLLSVPEDGAVPGLADHRAVAGPDVLDLGVLLEGVHGRVLAEAGRLVAAVRHLADDRDVVVDPHAPRLDLARGPSRPVHVPAPGGGGEPVGGVVGQREALVVAVERQDHQDRAEDLRLHDLAVLGCVGDESGPIVRALLQFAQGRLATGHHARVGARPVDESGHPLALGVRDQRAEVGAGGEGIAEPYRLHQRGRPFDELLVEGALHVGAGGGGAVLAGVDEGPGDRAVDGGVEVGVVEDDEGG